MCLAALASRGVGSPAGLVRAIRSARGVAGLAAFVVALGAVGMITLALLALGLLAFGLVSAGLGVSVLPASFQHMRIKGVVYRPLLDPDANTAVWLVQRKGTPSPMANAFAQLLTRKTVQPLP